MALRRTGNVMRLANPLKGLSQRFTFLGLVTLSIALIAVGAVKSALTP